MLRKEKISMAIFLPPHSCQIGTTPAQVIVVCQQLSFHKYLSISLRTLLMIVAATKIYNGSHTVRAQSTRLASRCRLSSSVSTRRLPRSIR